MKNNQKVIKIIANGDTRLDARRCDRLENNCIILVTLQNNQIIFDTLGNN